MRYPRTVFGYRGEVYFVDYPPGSMIVLWLAGKAYRLLEPGPETALLNVFVNLPPLLASIALAALLKHTAGGALGWQRALAFWWNPAALLGIALLGYQDSIFGLFAVLAVAAMARGDLAAAAALVVVSGLLKPQGSLLLPTFLALLLFEPAWRTRLRAAVAAGSTALLVLAPWWAQGHLLSALDGCRRPLEEISLSAQSLNLGWIASWAYAWAHDGAWPITRIVNLDDFRAWSGWDPRLPSRLLLLAGTLANVALLVRRPRQDPLRVPLSIILQAHLYALCGTSVHENHTYLAVFAAPLLLGLWDKARQLLALTSGFLFLNLFLLEGLGRGVVRDRQLYHLRLLPVVDVSVIVAVAHVALVALLFVWVARRRDEPPLHLSSGPSRGAPSPPGSADPPASAP